jgi:rhodanese-related sulfurtransferase
MAVGEALVVVQVVEGSLAEVVFQVVEDQVEDGNIYVNIQNMKTYIYDVRTPEEYQGGHIEGAINLPLDQLMDKTEYALSILKDIDKENDEIKVYCASGARASVAKNILEFMQYKNVVNAGGLR